MTKWKYLFASYLMLLCMLGQVADAKEISVADFGAIPNDGLNDADALHRACSYCREHPSTTLIFPAGRYLFADTQARRIEREAISGAYGEDVQGKLFIPKGPYVKGLDFTGCRGLTVKGNGATLVMQGWYEVLSLVRAHGVTIEGLSITYQRPPYTVGKIVKSTPRDFEMIFDPLLYAYLDSVVTGRVHFFDANHQRYYNKVKGHRRSIGKKELMEPGRIRIESTIEPPVGDYCVLRHGGHYRPCIMIKESENIILRNVKILSHPGMGVVGHLSKDILLDGLQVVPEPGRIVSTNTDATHFTSCSGTLTLQNCIFRGNCDDCTNVHNYYYTLYPKGNRVEIRIEDADLHALSLDYPQVGDTMQVVRRDNMKEQGRYVVEKVDTSSVDWKVYVTLDRKIRVDSIEQFFMTNLTRQPYVYITHNASSYNMGRAYLLKCRRADIRGNYIRGASLTAVKLGAELSWREAGPVDGVCIEDNYIVDCGLDGSESDASCVRLDTESPATPPRVNQNIVIRNNILVTDKPCAVMLKDADHVKVCDNMVSHPNYVQQQNCTNVLLP